MTQSLTVENETHWKTSDVKRIVRAAMDAAGADPSKKRTLRVVYGPDAHPRWWIHEQKGEVRVTLPKRGTSKLHPSQLVALAAAGIDSATPILPVQDSFFLANGLAWGFAKQGKLPSAKTLSGSKRSANPPAWSNGTIFYIAKYADPAKDASYVAFAERTQKTIDAAQARVDKWQAEADRAQKNLKRAKRDLKAAQKSLRDAKKRRGL